jgi:hypothetical protein
MSQDVTPFEPSPTIEPRRQPPSGRIFHSLDELGQLGLIVLEQLYRNSHAPDPMELQGAHRGRLLGFRGPFLPFDKLLRPVVAVPWFLWQGKVFDFDRGQGMNRLNLGTERRALPFDLTMGSSLLDGSPCLIIDYDRADNPSFLRPVRDELRALGTGGEGLFMGPSFWRGRKSHLLMFFGLDTALTR